MFLAILSRPWWKNVVKGPGDDNDENEVMLGAEGRSGETRYAAADGGHGDDDDSSSAGSSGSSAPLGGEDDEEEEVLAASDEPAEEEEDSDEDYPQEEEEEEEDLGSGQKEHLALDKAADEDPFSEEAYDLEQGRPLRDRLTDRGGGLPWRSKVKSAKEFFGEELLYRVDILEKEEKDFLRGTYRIELKGYRGGVWTISLGDQFEVVNRREEADIVFLMQQKDFLHLINGEINPQLAILAQRIRIQGDMRKAVAFQGLLVPPSE